MSLSLCSTTLHNKTSFGANLLISMRTTVVGLSALPLCCVDLSTCSQTTFCPILVNFPVRLLCLFSSCFLALMTKPVSVLCVCVNSPLHTPVLLGYADWHAEPAPLHCPFLLIGATLACMEIPSRDPWLTPDRVRWAWECARPQTGTHTHATARSLSLPRTLTHIRRQLLPLTGGRRPLSLCTERREEADSMPRSFLVKKHQSGSKKANYGGLKSETEGKTWNNCNAHRRKSNEVLQYKFEK